MKWKIISDLFYPIMNPKQKCPYFIYLVCILRKIALKRLGPVYDVSGKEGRTRYKKMLCTVFLSEKPWNCFMVGTIWRALSKPPQKRQGPDLRPLWLLVGTPSAIRPELAFSRAKHSLPFSDVTIYFLLYYIYHLCFKCIDFYDLFAWDGCWFVYIMRFIYKF